MLLNQEWLYLVKSSILIDTKPVQLNLCYRYLLSIILALSVFTGSADSTDFSKVQIPDAEFQAIALKDYASIYPIDQEFDDPSDILKVDESKFRRFTSDQEKIQSRVSWLKVSIATLKERKGFDFITFCETPDSIQLYQREGDVLVLLGNLGRHVQNRDKLIPSNASHFMFSSVPEGTTDLYARVVIEDASRHFHIWHLALNDGEYAMRWNFQNFGLQSFYIGIMLLFFVIGLFMFFSFRESIYLNYAIFIMSISLYFAFTTGLIYAFMPMSFELKQFVNYRLVLSLTFIFGYRFITEQLELRTRWATMNSIYKWYTYLLAAYTVLYRPLGLSSQGAITLVNILHLVWIIITLIVVIHAFAKKQSSAKVVFVSMSLLFGGAIAFTLSTIGVIPKSTLVQQSFQIGVVAFSGALIYGLFMRIKNIQAERVRIAVAREKSDELLFNILPEDIAQELKEKGESKAKKISQASIIFTDFKDFTQVSEQFLPEEVVAELHHCFQAFDGIMHKYEIEKIKTIGDAYMAAGGLSNSEVTSTKSTVLAALEMSDFIIKRQAERKAQDHLAFEMRVGIHTGPVVAGIVGVKKFQYDIWGDTVNTASRMESHGEINKVNVSQFTYELIKDDQDFVFEHRGKIQAKGKGEIDMYFVSLRNT